MLKKNILCWTHFFTVLHLNKNAKSTKKKSFICDWPNLKLIYHIIFHLFSRSFFFEMHEFHHRFAVICQLAIYAIPCYATPRHAMSYSIFNFSKLQFQLNFLWLLFFSLFLLLFCSDEAVGLIIQSERNIGHKKQ